MMERHVYDCSCPVCKDERRKLKAVKGLDKPEKGSDSKNLHKFLARIRSWASI